MTKLTKSTLVLSLVLNVTLAAGFLFYRSVVRSKMFKLTIMTFEVAEDLSKTVLTDLESDDPSRLAALKERLRRTMETAQENKAIWQQAAGK